MIKVHNGWTLAGAILATVIAVDVLARGATSSSLFGTAANTGLSGLKALILPVQKGS